MSTLDYVVEQWDEGAKHGFPPCCRARFIVSHLRPPLLSRVAPVLSRRLRGFTPRHVIADGMVPCEYHLLHWVVTGDKGGWRKPAGEGMCCQTRKDLVGSGEVLLARIRCEPDEYISEVAYPWIFHADAEEGTPGISIDHCPWCGEPLE